MAVSIPLDPRDREGSPLKKIIGRALSSLLLVLFIAGIIYIIFKPPPEPPHLFSKILEAGERVRHDLFHMPEELKTFLDHQGAPSEVLSLIPFSPLIEGYRFSGCAPFSYAGNQGILLFYTVEGGEITVSLIHSRSIPSFPRNSRKIAYRDLTLLAFDVDDTTFLSRSADRVTLSTHSSTLTVKDMEEIHEEISGWIRD